MSHTAAHTRRIALSVTTVGILAATLNSSILLISLPAIFDGLGLNPLAPANISYLLWMLMGYLLVTAVLVVTFGRLGDQYGRAKLFNLGFLIFTIASVACALVPNTGAAGALELIGLRVVQGIGGAMLTANSTAIITDAFPADRRGFAQGITHAAARLGNALTPPLIALLIVALSWRDSFIIVGLVSFAWVGLWWFYFRDDPREHKGVTKQELAVLPPVKIADERKAVPWGRLLRRMLPVTLTRAPADRNGRAAWTAVSSTPTPSATSSSSSGTVSESGSFSR